MQQNLNNIINNPKLRYCCELYFDLLFLMFNKNVVTDDLYHSTLNFIKDVRYGPPELYAEK